MTVANQYSGDLQSHLFEVWNSVDSFAVEEQQIWNPVNNPYQSLFPKQGTSDRRAYSPLTPRVECEKGLLIILRIIFDSYAKAVLARDHAYSRDWMDWVCRG
ncbi:conserved hypothetical protein [Histoplasma capsulatum var. duboisii H88]|uniref:Uncharacterized protein n=1 Tax=Ajellomyces capsulatus (strain H88) TaxID=544711 RepID=F0UTX6_AJEC8|nr:conserved hypothetical protein [Histoplasma capsulatum var. duboisii H88]